MLLHLTNDYSGSTVYKNLVRELDNLGIQQIVYNPVREEKRVGKNAIAFKTQGSKIIYRPILNYHMDRYVYPYKIQKILRDVQQQVDLSKIDFIHAHTWYSDGGVSYALSKKYKLPYIVTIRNTDLNLFQKKLKYVRPFGRKILKKAEQVVLISQSYKQRVLVQSSLQIILQELEHKLRIIPNGVDPFWINQAVVQQKKKQEQTVNLLYIGKFNPGKNVLPLQEAVKLLAEGKEFKVHLHLVGGDGADEEEILKKTKNHPDIFTYHGKIYEKERLQKVFQSCSLFVMPSKHETFGLVYVEAMLQGLPILYSQGEGIDGFYDEKIGEKVTTGDAQDIKNRLLEMMRNYETYQLPLEKIKRNHDWKNIAKKYEAIYKENKIRL